MLYRPKLTWPDRDRMLLENTSFLSNLNSKSYDVFIWSMQDVMRHYSCVLITIGPMC